MTRPAVTGTLLLTLLATLLWGWSPRGVAAQVTTTDLEGVIRSFARAWEAGDLEAVAGRLAEDGILLHLPGAVHPVLSHRLARAALGDLHDRAGRGAVAVRQSRLLGGAPPRAFLEMTWTPVPQGVSEPLEYTVFAGLEERGGGWWVVEVRVLSPGDRTYDEVQNARDP